MRSAAKPILVLAVVVVTAPSCSSQKTKRDAIAAQTTIHTTTSKLATPTELAATIPPTTSSTPSTTTTTTTIATTTTAPEPEPSAPTQTTPQPTALPLVGQLPTRTNKPTPDPVQVATAFISASLDADARTLQELSNESYKTQAVTLWIGDSGPSGQSIIAAKSISQTAGRARVAVFVDSLDLTVAALPFTVDLLQDTTSQNWTVIDAGLQVP